MTQRTLLISTVVLTALVTAASILIYQHYSCPPGYVIDPVTGKCIPQPGGGPGGGPPPPQPPAKDSDHPGVADPCVYQVTKLDFNGSTVSVTVDNVTGVKYNGGQGPMVDISIRHITKVEHVHMVGTLQAQDPNHYVFVIPIDCLSAPSGMKCSSGVNQTAITPETSVVAFPLVQGQKNPLKCGLYQKWTGSI